MGFIINMKAFVAILSCLAVASAGNYGGLAGLGYAGYGYGLAGAAPVAAVAAAPAAYAAAPAAYAAAPAAYAAGPVGYAGAGVAIGAGIAAPGYLGYGYAHPYDYAGQVYPAAEPYIHEEYAAEPYI